MKMGPEHMKAHFSASGRADFNPMVCLNFLSSSTTFVNSSELEAKFQTQITFSWWVLWV